MTMLCEECGLPRVPFGGEDICMGHDDPADWQDIPEDDDPVGDHEI